MHSHICCATHCWSWYFRLLLLFLEIWKFLSTWMADDEDTLLALAAFCVIKLEQQRHKRHFGCLQLMFTGRAKETTIIWFGSFGSIPFYFGVTFACQQMSDQLLCHIGPAIQLQNTRWRWFWTPSCRLGGGVDAVCYCISPSSLWVLIFASRWLVIAH